MCIFYLMKCFQGGCLPGWNPERHESSFPTRSSKGVKLTHTSEERSDSSALDLYCGWTMTPVSHSFSQCGIRSALFLTKICSGLGYTNQSKQTYKSIREIIILPVNISTVNKFVCQMAGQPVYSFFLLQLSLENQIIIIPRLLVSMSIRTKGVWISVDQAGPQLQ